MTRMAITTGIPAPSAKPRPSLELTERPFGAGDGDDEEVEDCMVDDVVVEGEVVGNNKALVNVESKADVGAGVAAELEDDLDRVSAILKYADLAASHTSSLTQKKNILEALRFNP